MQRLFIILLVITTSVLSGCVGLLFGSAVVATGATVATLHDRRTPGTVIDDRSLELVISKRILENKFINDNSHTNLTIYNGVVLVTGEVANQKVKSSIISLINTTPNVKIVKNDLKIMPNSSIFSRSKDSAITTKVKTVLLSLKIPNFDSTLINVSTERGKVYLMGLVNRAEASAIIEKTRHVSGVVSVTDVFEYIDN